MTEEEALMWYALRVAPRREFIAEQLLSQEGRRVYLPLETRWRRLSRHIRRFGWQKVPLIPSYLFVGVHAPWELDGLTAWSFVHGVVGDPGTMVPRTITDTQMALIRQTSEELCRIPAPKADWVPGRGTWTRYCKPGHVLHGARILVETVKGKRAREFFGKIDGTGTLLTFRTADVEAA